MVLQPFSRVTVALGNLGEEHMISDGGPTPLLPLEGFPANAITARYRDNVGR